MDSSIVDVSKADAIPVTKKATMDLNNNYNIGSYFQLIFRYDYGEEIIGKNTIDTFNISICTFEYKTLPR